MLGYLAGSRIGAVAYNLFQTLIVPLCLLAAGFLAGQDMAMHIAAIWLAHITIDRALGYGSEILHRISGLASWPHRPGPKHQSLTCSPG